METVASPRAAMVGPLHVDLFVRGSAPLEREALNAWVGPSEVDLAVAGSLGYAALALASLGWSVELHSAVGSDPFGEHIIRTLHGRRIDDALRGALRRPDRHRHLRAALRGHASGR